MPYHQLLLKNQSHLEVVVRSLFPDARIIVNSRKDSSMKSSHSDQFLELDVPPNPILTFLTSRKSPLDHFLCILLIVPSIKLWMPSVKLGFEYQDTHHYVNAFYTNAPLYEYPLANLLFINYCDRRAPFIHETK
jgi:hypothetical protein